MPKNEDEAGAELSTRPKNWPGIPGRSREHERSPESDAQRTGSSKVTEAQRKLESKGEEEAGSSSE